MKQLRFEEVVDLEECLVLQKLSKVNLETARGLKDRPDDVPIVEYVKNKATRIIEFVKNINYEWIKRERVVHEKWIPRLGWRPDDSPTELVQFRDYRAINRELLPVDAFVDQGTSQPKEPRFPSDKAIQRECTVSRDGKLLALHLNHKKPAISWKNPKWISKELGCKLSEAVEYVNMFKEFGFDRITTLDMLKKLKEEEITKQDLENLLEELPIVTRGPLTRGFDINWKKQPIIPDEQRAKGFEDLESFLTIEDLRDLEEEKEEPEPAAEVFGVHALHFEEDGCPHDFLTFLRFATIPEIKGVMKGMFPTRNEWGTKIRAKYWYLTPSQRTQVWAYINKRREELGIYERRISFSK